MSLRNKKLKTSSKAKGAPRKARPKARKPQKPTMLASPSQPPASPDAPSEVLLPLSPALTESYLQPLSDSGQVFNPTYNPVLAGILLGMAGGGGARFVSDNLANNIGNVERPTQPIIVITPKGKGGKPIASGGEGLLPERITGTSERVSLGIITDDKSDESIYELADNIAEIDNDKFSIENNELFYIGRNTGYYGATKTQKSYILKMKRKVRITSKTFNYVVNLQNKLPLPPPPAPDAPYIRPRGPDGKPLNVRIYSDGDSIIENADGTETRNFDTQDRAIVVHAPPQAKPQGRKRRSTLTAKDDSDVSISYSYKVEPKPNKNKRDDKKPDNKGRK